VRGRIRTYNLCFLGFGNVNRTLVRLLEDRADELRARHGIAYRITGIASRTLGWIADPNGLDPNTLRGRGPALSEVEGALARTKPEANSNVSASHVATNVRE
jgi:homoserine dehydrogenase